MTPLATLTDPVSMVPTVGSAVCQRMFPVATSRALHAPQGYLLSRGRQGVRQTETIRDSDINPPTVGRRTPLDASERTAGPNECAPNDVAAIWIECPIDAALLAKADNYPPDWGLPLQNRNLGCRVRDSSGSLELGGQLQNRRFL